MLKMKAEGELFVYIELSEKSQAAGVAESQNDKK